MKKNTIAEQNAVLLTVSILSDKRNTKETLQKRLFFVCEIMLRRYGCSLNYEYHPEYYGPYSDSIDAAVTTLKMARLLQESEEGFIPNTESPFDHASFRYNISSDGQITLSWLQNYMEQYLEEFKCAIRDVKSADGTDELTPLELASASKIFINLQRKKLPSNKHNIEMLVKELPWAVNQRNEQQILKYLTNLGLVSDETVDIESTVAEYNHLTNTPGNKENIMERKTERTRRPSTKQIASELQEVAQF